MNCIAHRDPRRELFNTLKKETNLILDSMTPSSAFATLISMKQGEKTQKIVAKCVYDRFRERGRRVRESSFNMTRGGGGGGGWE